MFRSILFVFLVLLIAGCASQKKIIDPYAHISDQKVVNVLKQSFATIGGLDKWNTLSELHYKKQTYLYFENGEIEMESFQNHDYFYKKDPSINISWTDKNGQANKITSIDGNASKYINGKLDREANITSLNTSVTTSLFVVGVPFKMLDKGVKLSYEGFTELEDGKKVVVLKAVYDPVKNAHHTTPDIWWYYFDNQDFRMVAYMIKHADHYSYVKNLAFVRTDGFLFPTKRGSYRVNPKREILYTRAEYEYSDWQAK